MLWRPLTWTLILKLQPLPLVGTCRQWFDHTKAEPAVCHIENRVDAATEMGSNSPGHPRPPIAKATTEITGKWQLPTIESKRNLEHDEKMQTMLQPYMILQTLVKTCNFGTVVAFDDFFRLFNGWLLRVEMAMVLPRVQNGSGSCTEDRFEANAFCSDKLSGTSVATAQEALKIIWHRYGAARALPAFVDCAMSHKAFRLKSPQNSFHQFSPVFTTSIHRLVNWKHCINYG